MKRNSNRCDSNHQEEHKHNESHSSSYQNECEQMGQQQNHLERHQESSSQSNWSNKLSQNFQRNFQLMKDEYHGLRDQWKSGEAVKDLSDRQSLRQHCEYIRDSAQSSWNYYRKHIWHQQFHSQDQSGRRGSLSEKFHQYYESHSKFKLFASSFLMMAISLRLRRSSYFFSQSNQQKLYFQSFSSRLREKMFGRGHSMQQEHFNHSGGMDDKHYQMMLQLSLGMLASCYMISMFNYLFFQVRLENRGNGEQESSEQQMEREAAQEGKK